MTEDKFGRFLEEGDIVVYGKSGNVSSYSHIGIGFIDEIKHDRIKISGKDKKNRSLKESVLKTKIWRKCSNTVLIFKKSMIPTMEKQYFSKGKSFYDN